MRCMFALIVTSFLHLELHVVVVFAEELDMKSQQFEALKIEMEATLNDLGDM